MTGPVSERFRAIDLSAAFNADRGSLDLGLAPDDGPRATSANAYGEQAFRGIEFRLGDRSRPNVIVLSDGEQIEVEIGPVAATWLVFLHAVEDIPTEPAGSLGAKGSFQGTELGGNDIGPQVATYIVRYADGASVEQAIVRRDQIQQRHIGWGASPFSAVPAVSHTVYSAATESFQRGEVAGAIYGRGETRVEADRNSASEHLWLYAWENPHPEREIQTVSLRGGIQRIAIYGLSVSDMQSHPLRPGVRKKAVFALPPEMLLDPIGELAVSGPGAKLAFDLGSVISARAVLDYDNMTWLSGEPDVQPSVSGSQVVIEYVAHPDGVLHARSGQGWTAVDDLQVVGSADRPVTIRVIDGETGQPCPVRLHMHGEAGEYLPPRGYHRKVNTNWYEDNYGEFANGRNQYCYITGQCVTDLPLGRVFVEITRGYEIEPIRTSFEVTPETSEITFTLNRQLQWREKGWVTADTHVHFLSPQTALLEGSAEGVNVVNLLASQWGEMFSNVSDFDGRTTLGAKDFGGDGEFLVRVGTENRQQVLGHISLLGYAGPMILPLTTGGPAESALGDPVESSMAEWAERCIEQGGLVVMPHFPNPKLENAADIVLDLVHAIEMMTFNPHDTQISPYGIYDWYRYLNLGYHLPVVGGSDKMSAASLLGGVRTYAHLGGNELTYQAWMDAIRRGNTFATVGPLIDFAVEGHAPGARFELGKGGGSVQVAWKVESVRVPIERVDLIVGGEVVDEISAGSVLRSEGSATVPIASSTWLALRVRGGYRGRKDDIAAHSSAVMVTVGGKPLYSQTDAVSVLQQIEGTLAYIDTLAPRGDTARFARMRASIASAQSRLHDRMHREGVPHQHAGSSAGHGGH